MSDKKPCVCEKRGCVYFQGRKKGLSNFEFICEAFPEGIPLVVTLGENDHSRPLKGQKNFLVFKK